MMADEHMLYDLVVVGASVGGIEALSTLVATLPAGFPPPIVVAQHLDPTRTSHLCAILDRRSALPVRTVADSEPGR
jgi:two-component system CheB/CheR fusion protein